MLRVAKPAFYASLRSVLNACHWHAAPLPRTPTFLGTQI